MTKVEMASRRLDGDDLAWALEVGRMVRVGSGEIFSWQGSLCDGFALLLQGRVSCFRLAPNGREVNLYRLESGDGCFFSATAALARAPGLCCLRAEEGSEVLLLSAPRMMERAAVSKSWAAFVFGSIHSCLSHLLGFIGDLLSTRVDMRLARMLVENPRAIGLSHRELADEIGSSREGVCRILKRFSDRGLVTVARGRVQSFDRPGLELLYSAHRDEL